MKQIARVGWLSALVAACGVFAAAPAAAQTSAGIRAGLSVDPDQFYFGGHVETRPLVDRLRFKPNVEIGVGNNLTVVAMNVEFAYAFPSRRRCTPAGVPRSSLSTRTAIPTPAGVSTCSWV